MFIRIPLIRADAARVRLDRIVAVITTDGESRVYYEAGGVRHWLATALTIEQVQQATKDVQQGGVAATLHWRPNGGTPSVGGG